MKLTARKQLVLKILSDDTHKSDSGDVELSAEQLQLHGQGQFGHGLMYKLLGRLQTEGLVKHRKQKNNEVKSGVPRKLFSITDKGREVWAKFQTKEEDDEEDL